MLGDSAGAHDDYARSCRNGYPPAWLLQSNHNTHCLTSLRPSPFTYGHFQATDARKEVRIERRERSDRAQMRVELDPCSVEDISIAGAVGLVLSWVVAIGCMRVIFESAVLTPYAPVFHTCMQGATTELTLCEGIPEGHCFFSFGHCNDNEFIPVPKRVAVPPCLDITQQMPSSACWSLPVQTQDAFPQEVPAPG